MVEVLRALLQTLHKVTQLGLADPRSEHPGSAPHSQNLLVGPSQEEQEEQSCVLTPGTCSTEQAS